MSHPTTSNQSLDAPPPPALAAPASATAVSLKLPIFWPADPLVWFAQVDAQFSTRGVTAEKTKFDYVVASLSPEYAQEVRDLILKPPSSNPYAALKDALVQRTAASEQRRLQQLFNAEELGDRKPTQLLRRMQQLLGDKASSTDASFLRELFLQRLPPNVRMVLASSDTTDLEKLAQLADKIVEVATPVQISTVSHSPDSEISLLRNEIAELKRMIVSSRHTNRIRPRSSSRGRSSRSTTPQRTTTTDADSLCWYHQRFGDQARKCQPPCANAIPENEQASR